MPKFCSARFAQTAVSSPNQRDAIGARRRSGSILALVRSFAGADLAAVLIVCSSGASTACAGHPQIDFDFGRTVACREVVSEEFASESPGEKLIELTLRLSVHAMTGSLDDVDELHVEIADPDRRMRVYAMSPETEMSSTVAGEIEVTTTSEKGRDAKFSLGGELPALLGNVSAHVTPSVSAGGHSREITTEKSLRLPPRQVVVASGTIDHQHGALFKLRPSSQTTLEGTHELKIQLAVSSNWRGDALQVRCLAIGRERFLWMQQTKTWSEESESVALFLAGDEEARHAAFRFIAR